MTIEKKHVCKCNKEAKTESAGKCSCKADRDYGYYSRLLKQPFDSVEELLEAEAAYYAEIKAKEDRIAAKKADAQKVEDAFKALNQARKTYKEDLTQLTAEYSKALTDIKKAFETGKSDIHSKLAVAEDNYQKALKEFTDKHREGYHLTLKDGDFETTISGSTKVKSNENVDVKDPSQVNLFNIFDLFFGL